MGTGKWDIQEQCVYTIEVKMALYWSICFQVKMLIVIVRKTAKETTQIFIKITTKGIE